MPTSWFRPHPLPDLDRAHSFDIAGEWNSAFGQVPCLWTPGDRVSGAVLPCLEGGVLHGWGQDWVPSPDGQFCHREGPMDGWLFTGEEEGVGVWSRVMWLSCDQLSISLLQCMENEKQNKILQSQRYNFQVHLALFQSFPIRLLRMKRRMLTAQTLCELLDRDFCLLCQSLSHPPSVCGCGCTFYILLWFYDVLYILLSLGEPVELSSRFIRYSTFRTGKEQLVS